MHFSPTFVAVTKCDRPPWKNNRINNTFLKVLSNPSHKYFSMHWGSIFNGLFVLINVILIVESQITPDMNDVAAQCPNISHKDVYQVTYCDSIDRLMLWWIKVPPQPPPADVYRNIGVISCAECWGPGWVGAQIGKKKKGWPQQMG